MDIIFRKRGGLAAFYTLNMKKIKTNGIAIMQKEEKTQARKGRKKREGEKGMEQGDEKYILKKKPQETEKNQSTTNTFHHKKQ